MKPSKITNADLAIMKLSENTNSISGIAKSFIENNAQKMLACGTVANFINMFTTEINNATGHGISKAKASEVLCAISKKKTMNQCMFYMTQLTLAGDGLKVA